MRNMFLPIKNNAQSNGFYYIFYIRSGILNYTKNWWIFKVVQVFGVPCVDGY